MPEGVPVVAITTAEEARIGIKLVIASNELKFSACQGKGNDGFRA